MIPSDEWHWQMMIGFASTALQCWPRISVARLVTKNSVLASSFHAELRPDFSVDLGFLEANAFPTSIPPRILSEAKDLIDDVVESLALRLCVWS